MKVYVLVAIILLVAVTLSACTKQSIDCGKEFELLKKNLAEANTCTSTSDCVARQFSAPLETTYFLNKNAAQKLVPRIEFINKQCGKNLATRLVQQALVCKENRCVAADGRTGDTDTKPTKPKPSGGEPGKTSSVAFTDAASCSKLSNNGFCKDFTATCSGVQSGKTITKQGRAIINDPVNAPKGTIFLLTGGGSTVAYHDDSQTQSSTITYLLSQGYRTVEIVWTPDQTTGEIFTVGQPVGADNLFCLPAAVYSAYLEEYSIAGPVCTQGNSGGSMQLAYPLVFYGTETLFDMIILTGGPPTASFTECCQGYPRSPYGFTSKGILGPMFIDDLSGFGKSATERQKYCKNALMQKNSIYDSPDVVEIFDRQSLVVNRGTSKNPIGDYDYPDTQIFFVESRDDISNANNIGKLYYNLISAKSKSFIEISGSAYADGGHNVPATTEGAAKIRSLFVQYCT